jgi:aryl-alcohol dehydrogenase-like predicted oxidoreductase
LFSGKIDRENYQHLEKNENNTALIKGYCYEENFQRLDRVKVLAQEKGCSIPQIALAFVLHSPLNVYPIIGAQDRSEIESACKTIDIVLTKQELDWIDLKTDNLT